MTVASGAPGDAAHAPKAAIIVRTRNRPGFLANALRDIAAQSFRNFEVMVVNDGGDQRIVDAIVANHRGLLPRVTVLHRTNSTGMEAASNSGIAGSRSEYLVVHDDDDTWHSDFLHRTITSLEENPSLMGIATRTSIIFEERSELGYREYDRIPLWPELMAVSLSDMLVLNRIVPISFVYRRSVHDHIGLYDESLPAVGDWEFYLRFLRRWPIEFLPHEPLAFWHQRPHERGASANSMFAAATDHRAYDRHVRDRYMHPDSPDPQLGLLLQVSGLYRQAEDQNRVLENQLRSLHGRVEELTGRLDDLVVRAQTPS